MTRLIVLTDTPDAPPSSGSAFLKHVIVKQGCGLNPNDVTIDPPGKQDSWPEAPIMTMGKLSMSMFMYGEDRISEYSGHIHKFNGRLVCHTFGLDTCFKQPNFLPLVIGHFSNLLAASREERSLRRPEVATNRLPGAVIDGGFLPPSSAVVDLEWDAKNRVTVVGFGCGNKAYSTSKVDEGLKVVRDMLKFGHQVIGHNFISADLPHVGAFPQSWGPEHIFDTKIAAHIVHPEWAGQGLYDLGNLVRYYAPTEDWKHDTGDLLYYNGLDCAYNLKLYGSLCSDLRETKQEHLVKPDQELHFITFLMHKRGIRVNRDELRRVVEEKTKSKDALKSGLPFNPNSGKQVIAWLASQKIFVNDCLAKTLAKLRGRSEDIDKLIDYRVDSKNISTWFDCDSEWVYPEFNVCGTNVARLSCSNPNFQNLPPSLRHLIIPRDRSLEFVSVDASQAENRWVAFYAEDEEMLAGFDAGIDNHQAVADRISKVVGYTVSRNFAKTVVHASNYGEKPANLAERLFGNRKGNSVSMARSLQEGYFAAYPKTRAWQQSLSAQMDAGDIVLRNAYGRVRSIYAMDSHERMKRACHYLGCSSAADMVNAKAREIYTELGLVPVLIVHDELVYEIEKGDDKTCRNISNLLSAPVVEQGNRPGVWEMKRGLNYGKISEKNPDGLKKC